MQHILFIYFYWNKLSSLSGHRLKKKTKVGNAPTLQDKQPDMITSEDKWIKGRKDSHHQILQDMEKNGSPQLG